MAKVVKTLALESNEDLARMLEDLGTASRPRNATLKDYGKNIIHAA